MVGSGVTRSMTGGGLTGTAVSGSGIGDMVPAGRALRVVIWCASCASKVTLQLWAFAGLMVPSSSRLPMPSWNASIGVLNGCGGGV